MQTRSWTDPLGAPAALLALLLGLPGCVGIVLGRPPRDWPIPFGLQLSGDIGLRTVIYGSGFLAAFGLIGLASAVLRLEASNGDPLAPSTPDEDLASRSPQGSHRGIEIRASSHAGHVPIAEPLYGFLPRSTQLRLARDTGYHALLYTKVSILLSAGVGVLLAGSWESISEMETLPPDAVLRIGAGLYLIAESARRYVAFSRGEPTGTLIGTLVSGALGLLRVSPTSRP